MNSEQKSELLLIRKVIDRRLEKYTGYSQNYTLSIAQWFDYCYSMGVCSGINALLLDCGTNKTFKTLNTKNPCLLFAFENGYAAAKTAYCWLQAEVKPTTSEVTSWFWKHSQEVFASQYPGYEWDIYKIKMEE